MRMAATWFVILGLTTWVTVGCSADPDSDSDSDPDPTDGTETVTETDSTDLESTGGPDNTELDCTDATIGSAPPCSEGCPDSCGCLPCVAGESLCGTGTGSASVYTCASDGQCFDESLCGGSDFCVAYGTKEGSGCVKGLATCEAVKAAYAWHTGGGVPCDDSNACKLLNGQCGVGLGGCYQTAPEPVTQAVLDALGAQFAANGCTQGVCDCGPPPESPPTCVDGKCQL